MPFNEHVGQILNYEFTQTKPLIEEIEKKEREIKLLTDQIKKHQEKSIEELAKTDTVVYFRNNSPKTSNFCEFRDSFTFYPLDFKMYDKKNHTCSPQSTATPTTHEIQKAVEDFAEKSGIRRF